MTDDHPITRFMRAAPTLIGLALLVLLTTPVLAGAQTSGDGKGQNTYTRSTTHHTTVLDEQIRPVEGPCDGTTHLVLVEESVDHETEEMTSETTIGPTDIMVGDDKQTPYKVLSGQVSTNFDTHTETFVVRTYQAVCGTADVASTTTTSEDTSGGTAAAAAARPDLTTALSAGAGTTNLAAAVSASPRYTG